MFAVYIRSNAHILKDIIVCSICILVYILFFCCCIEVHVDVNILCIYVQNSWHFIAAFNSSIQHFAGLSKKAIAAQLYIESVIHCEKKYVFHYKCKCRHVVFYSDHPFLIKSNEMQNTVKFMFPFIV